MFTKLLMNSACLAAFVSAERTEKVGEVTQLPTATADGVINEAVMGEILYTEGDS